MIGRRRRGESGGEDESVGGGWGLSGATEIRAQALLRAVLAGEVYGEGSSAGRGISSDGRLAGEALTACEAGRR